ncbi:MAG TPA: hypothetical protein VEJ87_01585 [Acidimicrobiales bacterium]|nr:hypothetical protein [Acidimicrobiales bacterium]
MKAVSSRRSVRERFSIKRLTVPRVVAGLALSSGLLGVASLATSGGSAQADPASTSAFVGVGSDTTQDLFAAYTGASPAPGLATNTQFYTPLNAGSANNWLTIASFDANPAGGTTVAPGCVTTKYGGNSYDRPNSSTAGIAALEDSITGTDFENTSGSCTGAPGENVTGQIDFARSARGPKTTTNSSLTFIPYARDALGFLYYSPGQVNPVSLTEQELSTLYSSASGSDVIGGVTVYACLTISGSVPRSQLESVLGVTDAQAAAAAAAADGGLCPSITQNSGNAFYSAVSGLTSGFGAVIPISSGEWESQFNNVALDRSNLARSAGVDLASITNKGGTVLGQPYNVVSGVEKPNTNYYQDSAWGYNLFTVVPTAKINGAFGSSAPLEALFGEVGSAATPAICETGPGSPQATANLFGFDSLTSSEGTCGSTATTGNS